MEGTEHIIGGIFVRARSHEPCPVKKRAKEVSG